MYNNHVNIKIVLSHKAKDSVLIRKCSQQTKESQCCSINDAHMPLA